MSLDKVRINNVTIVPVFPDLIHSLHHMFVLSKFPLRIDRNSCSFSDSFSISHSGWMKKLSWKKLVYENIFDPIISNVLFQVIVFLICFKSRRILFMISCMDIHQMIYIVFEIAFYYWFYILTWYTVNGHFLILNIIMFLFGPTLPIVVVSAIFQFWNSPAIFKRCEGTTKLKSVQCHLK